VTRALGMGGAPPAVRVERLAVESGRRMVRHGREHSDLALYPHRAPATLTPPRHPALG